MFDKAEAVGLNARGSHLSIHKFLNILPFPEIRIPGGFLLVFEGIDGAGKTTQACLAAQFFGERGMPCLVSKEPTGRKWGMRLRESARSGRLSVKEELELFILDRQDHVENVILPALQSGIPVILDRYYFSTAAYQGARGLDFGEILRENEAFAPAPDLLIILDVEPSEGLSRIRKRGDTPNTFESMDGLASARRIFDQLECECSIRIDASGSLSSVSAQVSKALKSRLREKIGSSTNDGDATLELLSSLK